MGSESKDSYLLMTHWYMIAGADMHEISNYQFTWNSFNTEFKSKFRHTVKYALFSNTEFVILASVEILTITQKAHEMHMELIPMPKSLFSDQMINFESEHKHLCQWGCKLGG